MLHSLTSSEYVSKGKIILHKALQGFQKKTRLAAEDCNSDIKTLWYATDHVIPSFLLSERSDLALESPILRNREESFLYKLDSMTLSFHTARTLTASTLS